VNAIPFARKPMTGTTAMAMMRLRTEILELSNFDEKKRDIEGGVSRVVLMLIGPPDPWPARQKVATVLALSGR
jgi:hypothetical protein